MAYKVVIAGSPGAGKSSFLRRFGDGDFSPDLCDVGKVNPLSVQMSDGEGGQPGHDFICVVVDEVGKVKDHQGANAAIIFVDSEKMWKEFRGEIEKITNTYFLVDSKLDLTQHRARTVLDLMDGVEEWRKHRFEYIQISAKSGYNIEKPFRAIAAELGELETEAVAIKAARG